MNRSDRWRIIGYVILAAPLVILALPSASSRSLFAALWAGAAVYYLYPHLLSFAAYLGYGKSSDFYLKLMAPAFRSRRIRPGSAASYAYILLREGLMEEAESVLDYGEEAAAERKRWRKGEAGLNHIRSFRALLFWRQGKLEEAARLLIELKDEGYVTSVIYGNLGWFLIKLGRLDEALELNREAAEYDRSAAILDNLGLNLFKLGRFDEAKAVYEEVLPSEPQFPDPYFNYGTLLDAEGDRDKARQMYQRALEKKFSSMGTVEECEVQKALADLDP